MEGDVAPAHQSLKIPCSIKGVKNHDIWALPKCFRAHILEEHSGFNLYTDEKKMKLILKSLIEYNPSILPKIIEYVTLNWDEVNL